MSPVRARVRVVGRRLDPVDCRLRDFLTRIAQPHEWLDADSPEAASLLRTLQLSAADLPVVVDPDDIYVRATVETIAGAWRLLEPPKRSHYDLAIIGGGPAGLG